MAQRDALLPLNEMEGNPAMLQHELGAVPATTMTRSRGLRMVGRLAVGAALALTLIGSGAVNPVAAQDDQIVLGGNGGATLTVSPGYADAVSAVAEAHAEPGHAWVEAAAARAEADSDCGAMTQGAAASAVAMPDIGSQVDAAIAQAKASAEETVAGIGVADDSLKAEFEECVKQDHEKEPPAPEYVPEAPAEVPVVYETPSTGVGMDQGVISSLLGGVAAAASTGAFLLRRRSIF